MNWIRSGILVVFGLSLLLLAVKRLRSYRLKERYALVFLFLGFPFLILAVWPGAIDWVAAQLRIQYFTVMLLAVSCFLILTVLELLTIISRLDQRVATLAQLVAILQEKQNAQDKPAQAADPAAVTRPVVYIQRPVRLRKDVQELKQ